MRAPRKTRSLPPRGARFSLREHLSRRARPSAKNMWWPVRLLLALALICGLFGCGGSGVGSLWRQPGIYLIDSTSDRLVWMSDMNATFFSRFDSPLTGISDIVDGTIDSVGHIYLIDAGNSAIVRFDNVSGENRTSFGSPGSGVGQFVQPVRVGVDRLSRIYVVDRGRNALVRFDQNGGGWTQLALDTWFVAGDEPAITFDGQNRIYLAGGTKVVRLNDLSAAGATVFGVAGSGQGQFVGLTGIALGNLDQIYLTDGGGDRIIRMDDMLGSNWIELGPGGAVSFDNPYGIGLDGDGFIYVADRGHHRMVRMDDLLGTNWTERTGVPGAAFSSPVAVLPRLPFF